MQNRSSWRFTLPTEIEFGEGVTSCLRERVAAVGDRPVLVTDKGVAKLPFAAAIREQFSTPGWFDRVEPNPTVANVDDLTEVLRSYAADVVVAIGGGSAMDCAKAACSLAAQGGSSIRPFHTGGETLDEAHIPLLAVPTTAGTGAEVTPFAVLDDRDNNVKGPIASRSFYPLMAVVDPELTYSMPLAITAATGLDALTHALEGYWSKNHQPLCDMMALEAAREIFRWFETVCRHPDHVEGRRAMSYAATLAGAAFQLPKNAMVHACSFPLSNRFHLPHGVACAFTLEFAIRHNASALGERMDRFVQHCGFDSLEDMVEDVRRLKTLGGLPCSLKDAEIPDAEIETLVEESFHPLMQNNPAEVTREDLRRMYEDLR